jgi:hypothetical protein
MGVFCVSRPPSNFRQKDISRAIRAAQSGGLKVTRVDVDPKTAKISVIVGEAKDDEPPARPLGDKPKVTWPAPRKRRKKDVS